uniref:Uncharacterized protein n=1 Tax=Panagrellus redivivus TaxID=6233 RepID=A0A7E4W1B8_PANRE
MRILIAGLILVGLAAVTNAWFFNESIDEILDDFEREYTVPPRENRSLSNFDIVSTCLITDIWMFSFKTLKYINTPNVGWSFDRSIESDDFTFDLQNMVKDAFSFYYETLVQLKATDGVDQNLVLNLDEDDYKQQRDTLLSNVQTLVFEEFNKKPEIGIKHIVTNFGWRKMIEALMTKDVEVYHLLSRNGIKFHKLSQEQDYYSYVVFMWFAAGEIKNQSELEKAIDEMMKVRSKYLKMLYV